MLRSALLDILQLFVEAKWFLHWVKYSNPILQRVKSLFSESEILLRTPVYVDLDWDIKLGFHNSYLDIDIMNIVFLWTSGIDWKSIINICVSERETKLTNEQADPRRPRQRQNSIMQCIASLRAVR